MASMDSNFPIENGADESYFFRKRKVFNDPIHGQIELHPVCVRIIDTPQFQRLRNIKQLDACYLVYPGASHNRFEHSIGTCHLAGKMMKTLQRRQPRENIDERDILCVEIAALCHDLGQGPFSHIYEKTFMPNMKKPFTHEETARKMFEYILEGNDGKVKNDIQNIIRECKIPDFGEFTEQDFLFIKEMIDKPKDLDQEPWPYEGRSEEKSFMYEIVANKRNGIDVDKWDYLARDSYMLGMKVNFEHDRCIMNARILKENGINGSGNTDGNTENNNGPRRKQICYREKNANDLYDMFYARMTLHRRAYQHKTHRIIGIMLAEALKLANDTVRFQGENKTFSISDAIDDMKAFTQLTDDVFQVILYSPPGSFALHSSDVEVVDRRASSQVSSATNPESAAEMTKDNFIEAKKILNNILNRRLFKYVTGTQKKGDPFDIEMIRDTFLKDMKSVQEEIIIHGDVISLDYGMQNKDPMENVRFYKKESDQHCIKLKRNQVSYVLPDTFAEHILSIYLFVEEKHDRDTLTERIQKEFQIWCEKQKLPLPKGARQQRENTYPKYLQSSERNTEETTERQSSGSEADDLELRRLVEPNTVSPNDEHQDEENSSNIGGVVIRSPVSDVTGDNET